MPLRRPSTDRTSPGYYRRPFHSLNRERVRAACAADLPVLWAAWNAEMALRRPRHKLLDLLASRIAELEIEGSR